MKLSFFRSLIILGMVAGISPVMCFADGSGWHLKSGGDPNSHFHEKLPVEFHDDITPDQKTSAIKLNALQRHQSLVWGLSTQEEKRYVALMHNRSGFFYSDQNHKMTPVEVLGANARTNAEREKYAKLDAHQQFQHLAKYLAYVAAYQRASEAYKKSLHLPVLRPFNTAKFSPYHYKPVALEANDKLMLFVHLNDEVRPIVASLMGSILKTPSIQLNVYFIGHGLTETQVQTWAKDQNIIPKMVDDHQITLNFDSGQFSAFSGKRKLPVLVLVRDGKSQFVDLGRF